MENKKIIQEFNNNAYLSHGFNAQRRYPNEELCRFMGRNFFSKDISHDERKKIKILETGCGSGANLWMIAREGFDTYGVDLSSEGIKLAHKMLLDYNVSANLSVQDMCSLEFEENTFDVIVDIFSSNCLDQQQGESYIKSVLKVLKPGGLFFSYFPSKKSDAFLYPGDSKYLDSSTIENISRKDAAFFGYDNPFRFMHPREYEDLLKQNGFSIKYSETIDKTYFSQRENFSFIVIEANKN